MAAYEYWRVEIQFTAGVWTDVTGDVDGPIRATNGATPETTGEPASLSLVLHNPGFRYTPGNASSPKALATGMPIRFFEVISDQTIYHFTGFIEFPEIGSVNLSMTQTQTISITAIDQLSAWERSSTFVSTLAAHVEGSADSSMRGYWPLLDAAAPYQNLAGTTQGNPIITPGSSPPSTQTPAVIPQGGISLIGDDGLPALLVPGLNGTITTGLPSISFPFQLQGESISLAAGQTLTAIAWVNLDLSQDDLIPALQVTIGDGIIELRRQASGSGGTFRLTKPVGTLTGAVNSTILAGSEVYYMVAIRYGFTPNLLEMWINDQVYTATLSGVLAGPDVVSVLTLQSYGSVAHAQLYIGNDSAFTYADFLDQRQVGLTGLERQTTGDRIKTLARYAGKTDAVLANVDAGCSVMQRARLAGRTVAEAMYEARDTEQGDLYVDGSGLLTFHDRRTILNI